MFSVKVHETGGEKLVACCDKELVGTILSDGELDLHVSERFYAEDEVDGEQLTSILSDASIANLIGDNVVGFAVEEGLVDEANVVNVCGVKHAQVFMLG